MKKLNLILLLCAVTVFSFGQLKVLNDGKYATNCRKQSA